MPDNTSDIQDYEDLLAAWIAGRKPQHQSWRDRRAYETGALVEPDKWVWVDHPTHSDYYPKREIDYYAQRAIAQGVDPYDFIALGISESGMGTQAGTWNNPTRVDLEKHFGLTPQDPNPEPEQLIDFSAEYLVKQFAKHKDRARSIQAYSGTGSRLYPNAVKGVNPPNMTAEKFFGRRKEDINPWRDQPQAKRVIDISERLKQNAEVQRAVRDAFKYWKEQ